MCVINADLSVLQNPEIVKTEFFVQHIGGLPRQNFHDGKGFGDVVVGAQPKPQRLSSSGFCICCKARENM